MANSTQVQNLDKIFASYKNTVEKVRLVSKPSDYSDRCGLAHYIILQLYQAGARNFVLLNEPPMDLAPNALAGLRPVISNVCPPLAKTIICSCLSGTHDYKGIMTP